MVTEGGLYILTLFDDFGGTYGKSDFGTGKRWCTVTCHPLKLSLNHDEVKLCWYWKSHGFHPLEGVSYFFFSTFGIINYRDVGNHLGLWIGQFLSWYSINVKTRCPYLLENLLAICLPSITFICIGCYNGIMEKIVTWWRCIPSMDKRNCFGTYFLINFIYSWNGHSSYRQKGWNKSKFFFIFSNVGWIFYTYASRIRRKPYLSLLFQAACKPTTHWGPLLPENRLGTRYEDRSNFDSQIDFREWPRSGQHLLDSSASFQWAWLASQWWDGAINNTPIPPTPRVVPRW